MSSSLHVNDDETDSDLVYALKERIRQLEASLGGQWRAPGVLHLAPSEERVLGAVVARGYVTYQNVYNLLYGLRADPPHIDVIKVFVNRVRRKMRPHNIVLGTVYSRGYEITPANLDRLKALYAPGELQPHETV